MSGLTRMSMKKHRIGVRAFLPFNSEEVEKHLEVVSGRGKKKNQGYLSSQKIKTKYGLKTYAKTTISIGAPKKQPALSFFGVCVYIYINMYYMHVYVCMCIYMII